jgi:hypothetical protein
MELKNSVKPLQFKFQHDKYLCKMILLNHFGFHIYRRNFAVF